MQEESLNYNEIIGYFSEETIADRFKYLYDKMQEYINERGQQAYLLVNEAILHQVVMDYFTDIYRLKKFHQIENINITKIIAYEVFWLLRRKPLQICRETTEPKLVFANEGFLTVFIAHELLIPEETEPLSAEQEERFLKYLKHINYHLKYRTMDKQCLEAMFYSFEIGKVIA